MTSGRTLVGVKVRHSTRCAGGCGLWLLPGAHAVRAHRGFWCSDCWARHAPSCVLVHPVMARPRLPDDDQLLLPM